MKHKNITNFDVSFSFMEASTHSTPEFPDKWLLILDVPFASNTDEMASPWASLDIGFAATLPSFVESPPLSLAMT